MTLLATSLTERRCLRHSRIARPNGVEDAVRVPGMGHWSMRQVLNGIYY